MISVVVVGGATLANGWDPGQISFCFLLGTIAYLAALERLIPYDPDWQPNTKEWRWYGAYFVIAMIGGALAQLPALALINAIAVPHPTFPLGIELALALLLGSLGSYLVHRVGHANKWLWQLHGIHHRPEKVNVANNGVNHIMDVFISQASVQICLALAGFSAESVFAVGLFIIAQGYFVHANIDVRIGWLNYVLASPEQHRLHHSVDMAEAGHYGSDLSIWDLLFGTFTWYPGRKPVAVGIQDPAAFPTTGAILATQLHPWRRGKKVAAQLDDPPPHSTCLP
ncbi:MAG: sterol desaturase family protein [Nakamurella sp.]